MQLHRPSTLVIFVAIFMLCGQVMATPLLICRNMFTANIRVGLQATDSMEHHCEGMVMVAVEAVDKAEDGGLMGKSAGAGADIPQTLTELIQDCDYVCQFYRGITSFDVSDSLFIVSPLLLRSGDGYLNRFVTPPIEVHFRPPINA